MVLKFVDIKSPVLRSKAKKVEKIDKKVKDFISDMKDTLDAQSDPEGVGLAAPQIGKSLQIFIINHKGHNDVVINPEIVNIEEFNASKKVKTKLLEGCLSLPHYYGPLRRSKEITIKFLDENGKEVNKTYKNFLAQIVQHELDHLNGVLFIDRILEQKAKLYKFSNDDWEEVELI